MDMRWTVLVVLATACGGGSGDGDGDSGSDHTTSTTASSSGPGGDPSGTPNADPTGDTTPQTESGSTNDPSVGDSTGPDPTTGGDPEADCGRVLFTETFEDGDFEARGWYDGPSGTLSTDEAIEGSTSSFECRYSTGVQECDGGTPGRHLFEPQTAVCLSYWVKYSSNWVGSQQPYHPHEFHFITNEDDMFVGPSHTRLTTYIEQVGGVPRLAIQDSVNVDPACILRNDDSFVGCDGSFEDYVFTEMRSAASCNGALGDLDYRDCFQSGRGWYSARFVDGPFQVFGDEAPWLKDEWHHVRTYWRLNDIENGVGVPNGVIRYWVDDELLVERVEVLMRTGVHPDMAFDQFVVAPYIGDGSPVDQSMFVDDLEVSVGVP